MAIDIGDAILSFLGDTTQLDATFNRVGAEVPAKMQGATAAIQGTTDAVSGMSKEMAVGMNGAVELGTVTNLAGEQSRESLYQARGEAGLLGEMFGIHLPRHVRSFIAELPGVGTALSAAFTATAVLFLIDALVRSIEKITEWSERGEKIAKAWEQYDQTIFNSSTHMQAEINKQEQKLIEMTQGPVAGLDFALKHLQTTAFETFSLITKDVEAAVKAMNEASSSLIGIQFNVFKDAGKDLEKFRDELQRTMRQAAEKSPNDPFAAYNAGISLVQQKERDLTALITQRTAASGKDASAAVDGLHAERQAVNDMLPLLQQGIRLQQDKDKVLKQTRADDYANKETADLKAALDIQLAEIEKWKAGMHAAREANKIDVASWKVAEVQAADAADIAHETYLEKLIAVYKRSGQAVKEHAAEEELATLRIKNEAKELEALNVAVDKYREHTQKLRDEWLRLQEAGVDKEFEKAQKAAEALTKAEDGLLKVQTALAETKITQSYRDQEDAIKKLAQFHLISEQQKSDQLLALYKREEDQALSALRSQLAAEQSVVNAAQATVTAAKGNPFFTNSQLMDLQKNLAEAETRYTATENQIAKAEDKFNKEKLAVQKGAMAQVIALIEASISPQLRLNQAKLAELNIEIQLAKARGLNIADLQKNRDALAQDTAQLQRREIAEKQTLISSLQMHQARLLALKDEIELTKARHGDVTALQAQEKEEKKQVQTLLQEAHAIASLGSRWKQFSEGFRAEGQKNLITIEEMGQKMRQNLQEFAADIGQEFAAMIQGQESFGDAMAHATEKLIGKMAQQWGEYFAAKAIADIFMNPALGAAEFAAAAALFTLGSLMSSLGSGGGSSAGAAASSGTPGPAAGSPNTTGATAQPTLNVVHLASGGLVTRPTLAVVGDAKGGGAGAEAVIPLHDKAALRNIMEALSAGGGKQEIHIVLHSDIPAVARELSRKVNKGEVRLLASNSIRVTRRS